MDVAKRPIVVAATKQRVESRRRIGIVLRAPRQAGMKHSNVEMAGNGLRVLSGQIGCRFFTCESLTMQGHAQVAERERLRLLDGKHLHVGRPGNRVGYLAGGIMISLQDEDRNARAIQLAKLSGRPESRPHVLPLAVK